MHASDVSEVGQSTFGVVWDMHVWKETAMRNIVSSTRRRGRTRMDVWVSRTQRSFRETNAVCQSARRSARSFSHTGSQQTLLTHHLTNMSNTSGSHCWSQRQCSSPRLCQAARCRRRWAYTGCNPGIELPIRHRHTHFEQRTARSSRRRCQWLYRTFR
jgi:hypothetical protein